MLVENTAVFDINIKGESGKLYNGHFVMSLFLSFKQRREIAVEYSKRDFGNTKDNVISYLNKLVAEHQARIIDCPVWYKGEKAWELLDQEPILAIQDEIDAALEEFKKQQDAE
jgi:hypothetical protein